MTWETISRAFYLLSAGGHKQGRVGGARCTQARLICLHVMLPVVPFVNVREAEFPVLVRLINALAEALLLFVLRQVEGDLDDPGTVTVEMFLQVDDGTIPLLPNGLLVE